MFLRRAALEQTMKSKMTTWQFCPITYEGKMIWAFEIQTDFDIFITTVADLNHSMNELEFRNQMSKQIVETTDPSLQMMKLNCILDERFYSQRVTTNNNIGENYCA